VWQAQPWVRPCTALHCTALHCTALIAALDLYPWSSTPSADPYPQCVNDPYPQCVNAKSEILLGKGAVTARPWCRVYWAWCLVRRGSYTSLHAHVYLGPIKAVVDYDLVLLLHPAPPLLIKYLTNSCRARRHVVD
jgi:hypothetical protein